MSAPGSGRSRLSGTLRSQSLANTFRCRSAASSRARHGRPVSSTHVEASASDARVVTIPSEVKQYDGAVLGALGTRCKLEQLPAEDPALRVAYNGPKSRAAEFQRICKECSAPCYILGEDGFSKLEARCPNGHTAGFVCQGYNRQIVSDQDPVLHLSEREVVERAFSKSETVCRRVERFDLVEIRDFVKDDQDFSGVTGRVARLLVSRCECAVTHGARNEEVVVPAGNVRVLPRSRAPVSSSQSLPCVFWPAVGDRVEVPGSGRGTVEGAEPLLRKVSVSLDGPDPKQKLPVAEGSVVALAGAVHDVTTKTNYIRPGSYAKPVFLAKPHLKATFRRYHVKLMTRWLQRQESGGVTLRGFEKGLIVNGISFLDRDRVESLFQNVSQDGVVLTLAAWEAHFAPQSVEAVEESGCCPKCFAEFCELVPGGPVACPVHNECGPKNVEARRRDFEAHQEHMAAMAKLDHLSQLLQE
mmetsp:Transcript_31582/g.76922  ORF Transcript_31582/g.76922 Transcript_31582/m.76922 type:complete len:471 (+) Transcript_31582:44-1456(+)